VVHPLQHRDKHFAPTAHSHLLLPVPVHVSVADGSANKPAKNPHLEFPGRAVLHPFRRTVHNLPARTVIFVTAVLSGDQKEQLPFHMHGDGAPSLLIAVHGLDRRAQQLSQLLLGLVQSSPIDGEFAAIHMHFLSILLYSYHGVVQKVNTLPPLSDTFAPFQARAVVAPRTRTPERTQLGATPSLHHRIPRPEAA